MSLLFTESLLILPMRIDFIPIEHGLQNHLAVNHNVQLTLLWDIEQQCSNDLAILDGMVSTLFISFHFILKFFKEGNPSAKMLVFKGPSN